jgi:hypothetical protein
MPTDGAVGGQSFGAALAGHMPSLGLLGRENELGVLSCAVDGSATVSAATGRDRLLRDRRLRVLARRRG